MKLLFVRDDVELINDAFDVMLEYWGFGVVGFFDELLFNLRFPLPEEIKPKQWRELPIDRKFDYIHELSL